jgi:serine phosphatase RsbU (regulator of sigma subunit)
MSEGKVLGVIDSEHPDKNFYTQEDLRILITIASMTSFKLVEADVQQELLQYQGQLEELVQIQTQELHTTIDQLHLSNFEKENLLTDITDSISYAKNIQTAILPSKKIIKKLLRESFIYYKPKDIVAGDFYWLQERNNKVLFAAADCTGHGVPGAMISVVCNNALNRSVREYDLTDPGKILDKTRDIIKEEFEKSGKEVNDGMDIALCSLEGVQLKYAGALIPVWIIRDGKIIEIKGDRQPIGKYVQQKPYTTHTLDLQKGDTIYIFSDGFVDQFGGEKGKKFKTQPFRDLLLKIQDKIMYDQKTILYRTFEDWKGTLEQIDDVCVIGVRV